MATTIVLLRQRDLRLHDNPALYHAAKKGEVLPLFVLDDTIASQQSSAQHWWLHRSLEQFIANLHAIGGELIIRRGNTETIILDVLKQTSSSAVFWNRCYEPAVYIKDQQLAKQLDKMGVTVQTFENQLLLPPWKTKKMDGTPYKVFTSFYKNLQKQDIPEPLPSVSHIAIANVHTQSLTVSELELLPTIQWTEKLKPYWDMNEQAALAKLQQFTEQSLIHYQEKRDYPSAAKHSALSPYLATGLLSARMVYHYILQSGMYGEAFLRQLAWREFSWHVLFHSPESTQHPLNAKFEHFRWENDEAFLHLWKRGQTGYPLVDAGMRELWETGFMHNRIRMVVASFLTKHLLIHWSKGADWFFDTLVDADLGNNTMGWQWAAGTGADAAPYFRIFNPVLQGKKFDEEGEYIKRWVPELQSLPAKYIHEPHKAPQSVLRSAHITIGKDYPAPIVDHQTARARALERYEEIK
ncbi:deoxyribodipyrimidine photo-lyase [Bacillus sp. REN10]|uniref:FAD-binding domain-containing protein n=1 Tax=Bacillus sp. REN10 TaxID=2782541 RepID=UPI00193B6FBA